MNRRSPPFPPFGTKGKAGGFSRRFSLPDDSGLNPIQAKREDGELMITIAKKGLD